MWPQGPATTKEVLKVSRRTTNIIQSQITSDVCLFGSAAAYLWADTGRVPNDVDILVNTFYYDAEQIKAIIVDTDDRYFLKPARWRNADYKVLFCRLPGWHARRRCVKVDILVPPSGKLGLPEILASDTPIIYYIPVMPLFALLVMKTQGWRDHRISPRKDLRAKEGGDVVDVDALLDRAAEEDVDYEDECEKYTSEFMDKALVLARTFVRRRGRREKWKAIGFPL